MTPLESTLVSYLSRLGATTTPIATESLTHRRTPDFLVVVRGFELILEIKELEKNDEEEAEVAKAERGEPALIDHSNDVGRFAAKIRDANKQLKRKCLGRPGLTVLADTRGFLAQALCPQQVLAEAMFGRETIWIHAPHPTLEASRSAVAHDFGLGRALGPSANTTTSAVALFVVRDDQNHELLIHHNPHAASPLPRGLFAGATVREFVMPLTREFAHFRASH